MKPSALFVMLAPIPMVLVIAATAKPAVWGPSQVAGIALLVPGLVLLTIARVQLGDSFSVTPQATALVTKGLYSRIRNPIYVFANFVIGGLFLYIGRPWLLLLLVPITVMQVVRAGKEAKALEARFGEAYRAYRKGTWF